MNGRRWLNPQDGIAWLVLAIAAALAALPLATHGYSCGHDFDFHLHSWLEASTQWNHGILKPIWAFHAAWNAGEPRLLFYPPLSWWTGGLLALLFPWSAIAYSFTALVLFLSGVTMHRLLRRMVSPGIAILGGCLYLANPYMLFCAYERTAYAELMAAAWMPLLLIALLSQRVTAWRIAIVIALLWTTNAPAAVIGCYTVLLIGGMRWACLLWQKHKPTTALAFAETPHDAVPCSLLPVPYFLTVSGGFLLGLLLAAFYLLPLAVERRYITLTAALTPEAKPDANFLFSYTLDGFHNGVQLHVDVISLSMIVLALLAGGATLWLWLRHVERFSGMHTHDASGQKALWRGTVPTLMLYSVVVLFLLTPFSRFVWHHAPELVFLQFPWRLLAMQSAIAVTLVTLLIAQLVSFLKPRGYSIPAWTLASLVLVLLAAYTLGNKTFRQGCDSEDGLRWIGLHKDKGFEQTDEYTPANDDNEALKFHLPAAWISPTANGTPPPPDGVLPRNSPQIPEHFLRMDDFSFTIRAKQPGDYAIVRHRAFHGWHILLDGKEMTHLPRRNDGLMAIPLPDSSTHQVEIRYRTTWDQWAGGACSLLGVLLFVFLSRRTQAPSKSMTPLPLE